MKEPITRDIQEMIDLVVLSDSWQWLPGMLARRECGRLARIVRACSHDSPAVIDTETGVVESIIGETDLWKPFISDEITLALIETLALEELEAETIYYQIRGSTVYMNGTTPAHWRAGSLDRPNIKTGEVALLSGCAHQKFQILAHILI